MKRGRCGWAGLAVGLGVLVPAGATAALPDPEAEPFLLVQPQRFGPIHLAAGRTEDGRVRVAFTRRFPTHSELWIAGSNDDGVSWSAPRILRREAHVHALHSNPAFAVNDRGQWLLVYEEFGPIDAGRIEQASIVAQTSADGDTWSEPELVSGDARMCFRPAPAVGRHGDLRVYFEARRPDDPGTGLFGVQKALNSGRWLAPTEIGPGPGSFANARWAQLGDIELLAYGDFNGPSRVQRSLDFGDSWEAPLEVMPAEDGDRTSPWGQLIANRDRGRFELFYLTYLDALGPVRGQRVWTRTSTNGVVWSEPTLLVELTGDEHLTVGPVARGDTTVTVLHDYEGDLQQQIVLEARGGPRVHYDYGFSALLLGFLIPQGEDGWLFGATMPWQDRGLLISATQSPCGFAADQACGGPDRVDAGVLDAGLPDAVTVDAASPDTGGLDARANDRDGGDGGQPGDRSDVGATDDGRPAPPFSGGDLARADAGCGCRATGSDDAGSSGGALLLGLAAAAALAFRRRVRGGQTLFE